MFIEDEQVTQTEQAVSSKADKKYQIRISLTDREDAILKSYMSDNMISNRSLLLTSIIKRELVQINQDLQYGL